MQKYPRGSRGSPAKGVVWETVARVRISSSAPKKDVRKGVLFWRFSRKELVNYPRVRARGGKGAVIVFLLGKSSPDAPPEWAVYRLLFWRPFLAFQPERTRGLFTSSHKGRIIDIKKDASVNSFGASPPLHRPTRLLLKKNPCHARR